MAKSKTSKTFGNTAKIPQSDFSVRADIEVLRMSPKSAYQIKKGKSNRSK